MRDDFSERYNTMASINKLISSQSKDNKGYLSAALNHGTNRFAETLLFLRDNSPASTISLSNFDSTALKKELQKIGFVYSSKAENIKILGEDEPTENPKNIYDLMGSNSGASCSLMAYEKLNRAGDKTDNTMFFVINTDNESAFDDSVFYFRLDQEKEVLEMIEGLKKKIGLKKKNKSESQIKLLYKRGNDLFFKDFKLKKLNVDIELNYGSNFKEVNEKYISLLNSVSGGLYMMSGCPGGGKTSYIKYLTTQVDRPFYYIPSNYIDFLDKPDFVTLLCEEKGGNPIVVLEDADRAIMKRDVDNMSTVSSILNISDGFMSDILNLSFIITYNTTPEKIDDALTRKGRCKFKYEFGPLNISDAQKKIDSLGVDYKVTSKMTLAEIYNLLSDNGVKKEKERAIGFNR